MIKYNIDCHKFYGQITIDDNQIIIDTSVPLIEIFIGQPLSNLTTWVSKKFGYCTIKVRNEI